MNRIYIGLILIIISILFGYFMSRKFIHKENFFNDFLSFNNLLKNEMMFTKNSLEVVIDNDKSDNELIVLLKEYIYTKIINKPYFINEEQYNFLVEYIKFVGTSDTVSQLEYLQLVEKRIQEELNESKKQRSKMCPTYIKLSVLIGIMLFILVI